MTGLDWALAAVVVLAAAGGATQGFIASFLGFAGFVGGALLGARLGPLVLSGGAQDPGAPVAALAGATVLGVLSSGLLHWAGDRLRRGRLDPRFRGLSALDAVLGAVFTSAMVLVAVWLVAAIVLQTPRAPTGWRGEVRRSAILGELRAALPPAEGALALLSRFDPLPGFDGPRAAVGSPDPAVLRDPGVRRGRRGTVRVEGSACGVGIVGSGWVAAPGYVVTNQHVIAGEGDTEVIPEAGGHRLAATPVHVDARQDIAILAVPRLRARPLRMVTRARVGTAAAILGYPLAGPFRARAARIGSAETVRGQDAYGGGPIERRILPFRGRVQEGNSGGPLVDRAGRVLGTVFASSTRSGGRGYAIPDDVVAAALPTVDPSRPVASGPCSH